MYALLSREFGLRHEEIYHMADETKKEYIALLNKPRDSDAPDLDLNTDEGKEALQHKMKAIESLWRHQPN